MPGLQIRDLPEQVYRTLSQAANRDHRSLTQQAVAVLARGLGLPEDPRARREHLLERIRSRARTVAGKDWPSPADLVREDRQR